MQAEIDHIREIETVSRGGQGARDALVVQSWLRCIEKHGLDPAQRGEAYILPEPALRRHRQRSEDLIAIARSGIDALYKLVAGQNYVLLLADSDGVTVEYLGEDAQKAELQRSGLYLGAEWSEARAGTCALGACIETGEPLVIHQSDHFDVAHGHLSCTSAPIYDTAGRLTAVLDISLLSSPVARASQSLALNLVKQTARRIELANIMAESRTDWVLRLAGTPDFLDVDPEAAVTLDAGGRVIGMTNGAARLMARTLGVDWRAGGALIGRHVSEIFDLDLPFMEALTRQHAPRERLIETRDGHRLFAHAIEPRRIAPRRTAPALPEALAALSMGDPVVDRALARAAALAPTRTPLMIEGPTGSGKTALAAAIHASRGGVLVTVPCESIAEDEAAVIFGRGDPRSHAPGLIDGAEGGTLVFDNPDELPERLQARLLALVGNGRYRPVGALRERETTARLIFLRNTERPEGLRADLLHRMGARLALPALCDRQDRVLLAERMASRHLGGQVRFDATAAAALSRHDWAGNLHALAALVAAIPQADRRVLGLDDLPDLAEGTATGAAHLRYMLQAQGWNISAVAREMGVDRSTVHRQIRRFGLKR